MRSMRGTGFVLLVALLAPLPAQPATPAVSAGALHSMALNADGTVRAWGDDSDGQLGTRRPLQSPTLFTPPGRD